MNWNGDYVEKIKVKIKINDYIIKELGTIDKGIIRVKNEENSIIFDTNTLKLVKENKHLKIDMDFKEKTLDYTLIPERQKFSSFFTINSLTNRPKQVIINYRIEKEDFLLKIEYETI